VDDEIAEIVREYGWYVANVNDHTPPFVYTIGLMETCRHPEFIIFGLDGDNAHALFSGLIHDIQSGKSFAEAGVYSINVGSDVHRIGIQQVHPKHHPLYLASRWGSSETSAESVSFRHGKFSGPIATESFPLRPDAILLFTTFSRGSISD
jgi:hypothetical protein